MPAQNVETARKMGGSGGSNGGGSGGSVVGVTRGYTLGSHCYKFNAMSLMFCCLLCRLLVDVQSGGGGEHVVASTFSCVHVHPDPLPSHDETE